MCISEMNPNPWLGRTPFDILGLQPLMPEILKCTIQQWLEGGIGDKKSIPPAICATLPGDLNHVFLLDFSGIFMY